MVIPFCGDPGSAGSREVYEDGWRGSGQVSPQEACLVSGRISLILNHICETFPFQQINKKVLSTTYSEEVSGFGESWTACTYGNKFISSSSLLVWVRVLPTIHITNVLLKVIYHIIFPYVLTLEEMSWAEKPVPLEKWILNQQFSEFSKQESC